MLKNTLGRMVAVEENEIRPMLLSALYFFLIMAGYFVIRPLRDDMGVARRGAVARQEAATAANPRVLTG